MSSIHLRMSHIHRAPRLSCLLCNLLTDEKSSFEADERAAQPAGMSNRCLLAVRFQPFPILLSGDECLIVRTIMPQDGERLQDYVRGLSGESCRNRFLGALSEFAPARLEELIRMRGPRQVVLLALAQFGSTLQMVAEAMLVMATNSERGEIALSVADAWQRRGLGTVLIRHLEVLAGRAGARYLFGDVLRTNTAMKGLARKNGYSIRSPFTDARLVEIVKELSFSNARPVRQAG